MKTHEKPIGEVLERLPKHAKATLMYAYEHGLPAHVCLQGREFIGVNTGSIRYLQPLNFAGDWSSGVNMGPESDIVELDK